MNDGGFFNERERVLEMKTQMQTRIQNKRAKLPRRPTAIAHKTVMIPQETNHRPKLTERKTN